MEISDVVKMTREQIEEVANNIAAGRKIQAIKMVRDATGWGLKEAKDWVDENCYTAMPDKDGFLKHDPDPEMGTHFEAVSKEEVEKTQTAQMRADLSAMRDRVWAMERDNEHLRSLLDIANGKGHELQELRRILKEEYVSKEDHEAAIKEWQGDYDWARKDLYRTCAELERAQKLIKYLTDIIVEGKTDKEETADRPPY